MKKERTFERDLDLWQYEMPYKSLTQEDIQKGRDYGVMIYRRLDDADYIVGTWDSVNFYMVGWLAYEMNAEYMKPLYVGK